MRMHPGKLSGSILGVASIALVLAAWHGSAADEPAGNVVRERVRERLFGAQPDARKATPDAESTTIAGLKVHIWRPPQAKGKLPLVIFSHGFHGMAVQSAFLTGALAREGYLVVAPNHQDAVGGNWNGRWGPEVSFTKPEQWTDKTYEQRGDDIRRLVEALHREKPWCDEIDWSRFALAGHSLGGYTVMGVAGAWPRWKLPEVKAVLAVSPYCSPYLRHKDLTTLGVPIMYQGGTHDVAITPAVRRSGGAYELTSSPAYYVEFDQAGHFAWTDLVADHQDNIVHYSVAFFNKHVQGDKTADPTAKRPGISDLRSK